MAIFILIFWIFSVTNSLEFIEGLGLSDTYHQIAHKTFVQQAKPFIFPSRILGIFQEFSKNSTALCFFLQEFCLHLNCCWISIFLGSKSKCQWNSSEIFMIFNKISFYKEFQFKFLSEKKITLPNQTLRWPGGEISSDKSEQGTRNYFVVTFFYLFCYLSIVLTAWIQYTNNLVVIFLLSFFSFASIAGRENQEHWSIITYCVTTR